MLANLMFFWDWDGAPIAPVIPATGIIAGQDGYGARGKDPYHPLPEEYWEARAKIIQVDSRDPGDVFKAPEIPGIPGVLNHAVSTRIDELSAIRDTLAANLMSSKTVDDMKAMSSRISELDGKMRDLTAKKYQ